MKTVNIHAARTHLSRLLEEVAAGEEIIIAKATKPMARLVPLEKPDVRKTFGMLVKLFPHFDTRVSFGIP